MSPCSRSSSHCCCAAASTAGLVLPPPAHPFLLQCTCAPPSLAAQKPDTKKLSLSGSLYQVVSSLLCFTYMSVTSERLHNRGRPVAHSCTSLETYFLNTPPPSSLFFCSCFSAIIERISTWQAAVVFNFSVLWCVCVCVFSGVLHCWFPFYLAESAFISLFFCASFEFWGGWRKGGRGTHCYEAVLARRFWEHWIDLHTPPAAACVSVIVSVCCGGWGGLRVRVLRHIHCSFVLSPLDFFEIAVVSRRRWKCQWKGGSAAVMALGNELALMSTVFLEMRQRWCGWCS